MIESPICGSSPLARGTPSAASQPTEDARLIPARAGNTFGCFTANRRRSAHPRSRGEHLDAVFSRMVILGSSPLARGTHWLQVPENARARLIPARAGNTSRKNWVTRPAPAHPRSRGEHDDVLPGLFVLPGSSPLARGTRSFAMCPMVVFRLIPARAGNTRPAMESSPGMTAHPRSRGEHELLCGHNFIFSGSSPLARGTP